jgi:hypothetical protein
LLSFVVGAFRVLAGVEVVPEKERRRVIRMRCRVPVLVSPAKGDAFNATVLDIGLQGLRLVSDTPLAKGSRVDVSTPSDGKDAGGPLVCKVAWMTKSSKRKLFQIGLVFEDSDENKAASWMRPVLSGLGFAKGKIMEKRLDLRIEVGSLVRVAVHSLQGDFLAEGRLVDLSSGGAQVSIETQIPRGTQVILHIGPVGKYSTLECPGAVLIHFKDVANQRYFHRVKFHSIDAACRKSMRRYLGYFLKEHNKS